MISQRILETGIKEVLVVTNKNYNSKKGDTKV